MLVKYFGPAINVGPAVVANIMKGDGKVMHFSKYYGLEKDDKSNQAHISLIKDFDSNIRDKLRPEISPDDFPYVNLEDTPLYDMYEDNTTDVGGALAGKTEDG